MTDSGRPLRPAESASPARLPGRTDGPVPIITTSGRLLTKRPTCSQCRIRKVRCDGQHPVCGNCSRLRFECSFEQTTRPTRSDYVFKVPEARRRMQACVQCHDKKIRCLGELPSCTNCTAKGRQCTYPVTGRVPPVQSKAKDSAVQRPVDDSDLSSTRNVAESTGNTQLHVPKDASPSPDLTISLVDDYFRHLYPLPSFSFLHKPTVIQRCRDGTINEQLRLAICAITALHLQRSTYPHHVWVQQAEDTILKQIGQPSIFQLQSLFLVVRYRIESGGFPKAFMLAGLAARTAVALRLNYERNDLSFVAQEARRRLYWSLYLLDDYFCVGLREFELCPEETIHLQLPCTEDLFEAGAHKATSYLHPDLFKAGEPTGLHASYLRITSARRANMRFIRKVGLGEESPATLRKSIELLEQNLSLIHASMADLGTYSLTTLTTIKWQAEYLMLHISWHQCHCDLYRSFIDSYSEAAPVAVLEGLHPQDRAVLERKCIEHAETIIRILFDFVHHGQRDIQLERDVAVCAFEAARIVMFDCQRTGLVSRMHEALAKANMCFELITRHFSFSASTQPLWKEFKRLIDNYASRKDTQSRAAAQQDGGRHGRSISAAQAPPPSPGSSRLSEIATARQKLSVQSLLLQSDFVDDSDEIAYPADRFGSRRPNDGAGATGGILSPAASQRDHSRLAREVSMAAQAVSNHTAEPMEGVTPIAMRDGQTAWNGMQPHSMENNNGGNVAPIASHMPSSDAHPSPAGFVAQSPMGPPPGMDPSSLPPAVPGFDPSFVFNPWMGFSGNEELRAYHGLAGGVNEEY